MTLFDLGLPTTDTATATNKSFEEVYTFPASFSQARLWFFDQLEPGCPEYNMSMAWELQGILNVATLQCSLNQIVKRHEILRTTFATVNGQLMQVIKATLGEIPLPIVDSRHISPTQRKIEAKKTNCSRSTTSI